MSLDVAETVEEIIDREGGDTFTNHPEDHGGPTRFGVTLPALSSYLGRKATITDLKLITRADAHDLYIELFLRRPGFGVIGSQRILSLLLDMAVNHGPKKATQLLQRALGVKDDGIFGPITKQAAAQADFSGFYRGLVAERVRFYGRIIGDDYIRLVKEGVLKPEHKCQAKFAAGWASRVAYFVEQA